MSVLAEAGLIDCHPVSSRVIVSRDNWQDKFRRGLRGWRARQEQRRALASLTDREFHDMGHSQSELEFELAKPFCAADVPSPLAQQITG